jgi:rRNA biogenesis protein RRP5
MNFIICTPKVTAHSQQRSFFCFILSYHLSLADIDAARRVAQRAFDRIEFRQEKEKLNVWMAFLTLELKYGSPNSLDNAMENACKQNNPKQVYLRMCEILEKEVDAAMETGASCFEAAEKADAMFLKMCKRFKGKKTAWLAYAKYKLKMESSEAANNILKRSLLSLPAYKHVEMVSKVAELEFELGSPERGRTLFLALLAKNPKRLDLLFVFIDKEIKCQNIDGARVLFKNINQPCPGSLKMKLNDKQMKSLFKKWFRMEEAYGDINSQNLVKLEATSYVQRAATTLDVANNAK